MIRQAPSFHTRSLLALAWIAKGPRCAVFHVRFSTRFGPCTIAWAQGCWMLRHFMMVFYFFPSSSTMRAWSSATCRR